MFVELPGRPAREPAPMLSDPRGTGRYQHVTAATVLAVGPILTHRFDLSDIKNALDTAEQGSAIKVAVLND